MLSFLLPSAEASGCRARVDGGAAGGERTSVVSGGLSGSTRPAPPVAFVFPFLAFIDFARGALGVPGPPVVGVRPVLDGFTILLRAPGSDVSRTV